MEWIASVVIGYIVFEIVARVIKSKIGPWLSRHVFVYAPYGEKGWREKIKSLRYR
jgi:hypothetical protein